MSNLEIGYEGSSFYYRDTTLDGNESHAGSVVFDLNFSSRDTLHIEGTYTRAVTELQTVDADSDLLVRQGIPYNRSQWAVEWLRRQKADGFRLMLWTWAGLRCPPPKSRAARLKGQWDYGKDEN